MLTQGSNVYVSANGTHVDCSDSTGSWIYDLTQLPQTAHGNIDYNRPINMGNRHHDGALGSAQCTNSDFTPHYSQGRIQETPKQTHL